MLKKAPKAYSRFVSAYPLLGEAWDKAREAEIAAGAMDEKSRRLVKLAVAVGAMREGAVSSAARKARAAGVSEEEIRQVVALAATTLGFPSAVAVHTWIEGE